MPRLFVPLLFTGLLLAFTAGKAQAQDQIATLTPVADTSIMEGAPFNNLGAVQSMAVGVTANGPAARGLVRFDLSGQIPANATVNSVALLFPVIRSGFLVEDSTFALHRVKVAWGEGTKGAGSATGTGAAATAGEATWVSRQHPTTNWRSAGGGAGDDYQATPSATADVTGSDGITFLPTPELAADVQAWLANPASNFGWLIKDLTENEFVQSARRLASREFATVRPTLLVEYSVAAAPLQISDARLDAGRLCFQFQPTVGKSYTIERRTNVASGPWTVIQTIPVVTSPGPIQICDPIGSGPQFYRVATP